MATERFNLTVPWEEVKEKLKENNINLTDEDLSYEPGREEELLQRLERKINRPREEIKGLIESIATNTDKAG